MREMHVAAEIVGADSGAPAASIIMDAYGHCHAYVVFDTSPESEAAFKQAVTTQLQDPGSVMSSAQAATIIRTGVTLLNAMRSVN